MQNNKSRAKCIIMINDKEYEGTFYKFIKNDKLFIN